MSLTGAAGLSVFVLLPMSVLIGLGLWARWLWKRTSAPRWLILLPAVWRGEQRPATSDRRPWVTVTPGD